MGYEVCGLIKFQDTSTKCQIYFAIGHIHNTKEIPNFNDRSTKHVFDRLGLLKSPIGVF